MDKFQVLKNLPTPCFVIDEEALVRNLEILRRVEEESKAHILLAQKAFSNYKTYPLIGQYLSGTTASGLFEARLAHEEMPGKQVHVFSPAYKEEEIRELVTYCDHIVFNSFSQWRRFRDSGLLPEGPSYGLRINPEYSEIETELYNPCSAFSRLGIPRRLFDGQDLTGISGLHFHTMCEQGAETLQRTLRVVEESFGGLISRMKWINFGGGHHITKPDYNLPLLVELIRDFRQRYGVEVYLEPGEAVAQEAGFLVCSVVDVIENGRDIAVLDTSAACHMPDVLEMPYRPEIVGAGKPGEKPYVYRLGGPSCLAGDVMGDYSFDSPLSPGDRLVFTDMAMYTTVKTNTFNGMPLPCIRLLKASGEVQLLRSFGYEDFKNRL